MRCIRGVRAMIRVGVALLAAVSTCPALAASYTWSGGGADSFWDTGSNWVGGVAPDYSLLPTTLQFSGTTRTTATNREPFPLVAYIDFTNDDSPGRSSAFTLSGSAVRLDPQSRITTTGLVGTGTITDTIALPLLLNGGVTFSLGGTAGAVHNLAVTGGVSGSGTLVASGTHGTLTLSGSNPYAGSTWVRGGTLLVPSGGVLSGSSAIRVAVSPLENATLRVDGGLVVSSTAWIAHGEPGVGTATVSSGTWINVGPFDVGRSGTGTLNIVGTGVVTVGGGTGTVTLAPASTNARSTLNLGDGTTAGTLQAAQVGGTSAIANGASVNFNHASSQYVFAPQIVGNVSVTHVGSGRTILTGSNSYSGTTLVQAGTLQLARPEAIMTPVFTTASGATLAVNVGGAGEFTPSQIDFLRAQGTGTSGFLDGSSLGFDTTNAASGTLFYYSNIANPNGGANALGIRKLGTGGLVLSGSNTFTGGVVVDQGTLTAANAYALGTGTAQVRGGELMIGAPILGSGLAGVMLAGGTISGTAPLLSRSTFDVRGGVITASLTGTIGLTKTTSGTVLITGSNSYSGPTIVQEGTLRLARPEAIMTPVFTTGSGATLAFNVGGAGEFTSSQIDFLRAQGTGTSGFLDGSSLGFDTTNAASGTFVYSSNIANPNSGANALGIAKSGAGTLVLSGSNAYTGGTTLAGGVVAIEHPNALGSSGTLSFSGGTLRYSASNTADYSGRFSTDPGQAYSIDTYGQNVTFATALMSTGGSLDKLGAGTLTLTGTSDAGTVALDMTTNVRAGVLSGLASGTSFLVVGFSGTGTLNLNGGNVNAVVGSLGGGYFGGVAGSVGTANVTSGTWNNSSTIVIGNRGTGTLNVNGGSVVSLFGELGYGAGSAGLVTVSSGTWSIGKELQVGRGGTGTLTMTGGLVTVGGTLSTGNYGAINLNAGGTLQIGTGGTTGVLGVSTLANNGTLIFSRSDVSAYSGVISGSGTLMQAGSGRLTLSASNSFSGPTTVAAGRLALAAGGAISSSPVVTVAENATLDVTAKSGGYLVPATQTLTGRGTVDGSATFGGGATLSPGASPGTLTITQGLTWAGGGNYNWQVYNAMGTSGSATGWDLVSVGGALDVSATGGNRFNINLWSLSAVAPDANGSALNFNPATSGTWRIATAAGGITGFDAAKFAINVSATNGTGGFANNLSNGTFSLVQQGNDVNLVFTPALNPNPAELTWYGDGVNPGGGGTWSATGNTWFDGTTLRPWVPGAKAIFSGSAGTVTLGSGISADGGIRFASTGFTLAGAGLTLGGTSNAVEVATGATATISAPLAGTAGLAKTGEGSLSLAAANTLGGTTIVQSGTVVVADGGATANSAVTVQGGAALKIDPAVTMRAPSLTLSGGRLDGTGATVLVDGTAGIGQFVIASGTVTGLPSLSVSGSGQVGLPTETRFVMDLTVLSIDQSNGGKLDIGVGRINVAAGGITAADLRADLLAARNGGSWDGASGIGSSEANSAIRRAVGYRVTGSGAIVAWAAFGDMNLDGVVNSSDLNLLIAGGKYGTGATDAVWAQGDFNYDGLVNTQDLNLLLATGLYGQPSYLPSTTGLLGGLAFMDGGDEEAGGLSGITAVPEPSSLMLSSGAILVMAGFAGLNRLLRRRRKLADASERSNLPQHP